METIINNTCMYHFKMFCFNQIEEYHLLGSLYNCTVKRWHWLIERWLNLPQPARVFFFRISLYWITGYWSLKEYLCSLTKTSNSYNFQCNLFVHETIRFLFENCCDYCEAFGHSPRYEVILFIVSVINYRKNVTFPGW